jgi:2-polyprenyl-6-methoxyphenol hydroxylase-like FAD-dependent oxidoreductase
VTSAKKDTEVLIVGAGPVGLIIALLLAQNGIKSILLEQYPEIIQSPRAMAYGPAAVVELERAGIAAECREIGMEPSDYEFVLRWITIDNKLVTDLDSSLMEGFPPVLCGQHEVAKIILRRLAAFPELTKVLWEHKVVGVEQDSKGATVVCDLGGKEVRVTGNYVVGADGARSSVRKLIGCTFDGFTYPKMVVATNVYYPFRENGFADGQFIIHPEHFAMVPPLFTHRQQFLCGNSVLTKFVVGRQSPTRWHVPRLVRRRCKPDIRTGPRQPRQQIQRHLPRSETRDIRFTNVLTLQATPTSLKQVSCRPCPSCG